jgi:hypothetical protein
MAVYTYAGNVRPWDSTAAIIVTDSFGADRKVRQGQGVDISAGVLSELEANYVMEPGGTANAPLVDSLIPPPVIMRPVLYDPATGDTVPSGLGGGGFDLTALNAGQHITWNGDTDLFRASAGVLKVGGGLSAAGEITAYADGTDTVRLGQVGTWFAPGIDIDGSAIYSQAAATIETNADFISLRSLASNRTSGTLTAFAATQGGNNYFTVRADGRMQWYVPAGGAADTNLYRSAADFLSTDDNFVAALTVFAGRNVVVDNTDGGYKLLFGAAQDTNLYRNAANVLKTDDALAVAGSLAALGGIAVTGTATLNGTALVANPMTTAGDIIVGGASGAPARLVKGADGQVLTMVSGGVAWAAASGGGGGIAYADLDDIPNTQKIAWLTHGTNVYSATTNTLKTDGAFQAVSTITAQPGGTTQVRLSTFSGGAAVEFGSGAPPDARIYRFNPSVLRTDGDWLAGGLLYAGEGTAQQVKMGNVGTGSSAGVSLGNTSPVTLYKYNSSTIATDGEFLVGGKVTFKSATAEKVVIDAIGTGQPAIIFGSSGDVSLYRAAADRLKTDDEFQIKRATTENFISMYNGSDANPRYSVSGAGVLNFGAGGATAPDTNLYRNASNSLRTDDSFSAAYIGSDGDVVSNGNVYGNIITAYQGIATYYEGGSTPGSVVAKMPVYDTGGSLLGWMPVYDDVYW